MAYYMTTTGAGSKTGADWNNAWSYAEFETNIETGSGYLYEIYVEAGTYTLTSNLEYNRATAAFLIGVKSGTTAEPPTEDDWAYKDDRPTFACGSYAFSLSSSYHKTLNFIFTGSYNGTLIGGSYNFLYNIKVTNTYNSSYAKAIFVENYSYGYNLEGICTYGNAITIYFYSAFGLLTAHDSNIGIELGTRDGVSVNECIAYNCTIGMKFRAKQQTISDSTIYNCTTGLDAYGNSNTSLINSNIINCTTGISSGYYIILMGNNFYNCTTRLNYTPYIEISYSELDPQFKDADNENFEPQNLNLIGKTFPETFAGTNTTNQGVAGACQLVRKKNSTARFY